jgi:ribonuclease Y
LRCPDRRLDRPTSILNHLGMLGIAAGIGAGLGIVLGLLYAARVRRRALKAAQAQAQSLREQARAAAEAERRQAEIAVREETLGLRAEAEAELSALRDQIERREEHVARHEQALEEQERHVAEAGEVLAARQQVVDERQLKTKEAHAAVRRVADDILAALEGAAGESRSQVEKDLVHGWIEEARGEAAARLRAIDQNAGDPEYTRQAKRLMGIAIQRYQGHYLTERLLSTIMLTPEVAQRLVEQGAPIIKEIEEQSGTKLGLTEAQDGIRIEGADGVGREIARRVLHRIIRTSESRGRGPQPPPTVTLNLDIRDPKKLVQTVAQNLDREIVDLGKKAFAELELPKGHPDLVKLLGRLNYRTSYTQNQWKHSVEAAFLAGLMASELGLDPRIARRATLLHDVGKALSHELEGSHALIGADYARRYGEAEIIVNAIAAHHGEAPAATPYDFLVAAADALSGGRPGARREMVETYVQRIVALERIAQSFPGVERAMAVQAGREVRIQVREAEVSDAKAAEMAGAIAKRISAEVVFPGQIKVTVIRELRAVEVCG